MRLRRSFTVATIFALLLVPSAARADESSEIPTLAGETKVTAEGDKKVALVVPRDLALPTNLSGYLKIAGPARFVAAALVEDVRTSPTVVFWERVDPNGICTRNECSALVGSVRTLVMNAPKTASGAQYLPKGNYSLHLVASDNSSVTAELRFPELSGSRTIKADLPAGARIKIAQNRNPVPVGAVAFYGGAESELRRTGLLYRVVAVTGGVAGPGEISDCIYRGEPQVKEAAYMPGCPGAAEAGGARFLSGGTSYTHVLSGIHVGLGAGTYGQGGYFASGSTIDAGLVVGLWLDY